MMTALLLCSHLYGATVAGGGHVVQDCKASRPDALLAAFVIGPDAAHLGVGAVVHPSAAAGWAETLAALEARKTQIGGAGATVFANAAARVAVVLPALPSTSTAPSFIAGWVQSLGDHCIAASEIPVLEGAIARERANPGGVVDLRKLHDLGARLDMDRELVRGEAYRVAMGEPFPVEVCK